ncbi:MAG: cytochrome c [Flavobacteriales bacterium]
MRDQLHLMELVDNYLDGIMNSTDRAAFEERMRKSDELTALVEDQQHLRRAARRSPARAAAKKAYRKHMWGKWAPWAGVGAAVLIASTAALFLWTSNNAKVGADGSPIDPQEYRMLTDTTGTRLDPLVLIIDPTKDTTLVTPSGVVLDIPQGAFVDSLGVAITTPVRLTILEAFDPLDIMKAGLSTMSGDTLLESGGMFYLDAQANGKPVKIDPAKPLTAMVPAILGQDDMQLYQGVKRSDGIIDWRNPKPLKKSLVPVDITTLNFYPPGYEAKLADLGQDVTDKAFKDSLYYSFVSRTGGENTMRWPYEDRDFVQSDTTWSPYSMGQKLFFESCAGCHTPTRDLTGPALQGAKARWAGKRSIQDFVRNSQEVIASGDVYAQNLFRRWKASVMTKVELSDKEIDAILLYADAATNDEDGIDPTKIKTIWNARFNNTNLATKEFEERMRALHGTCNNAALDAYVNNLDRDLSEIDQQVGAMGYPEFDHFAERNDGHVELPAHAADRLRTFYENNSRAEAEAIRKTQDKFWRAQWKQDVKSDAKRAEHAMADEVREGELFQKELQANIDTVYAQLGLKHRWMPRSAWVVPVVNTGWWNVDIAVIQATTSRASMSYTDPNSDKTATLTYTPLIVEVADRASFDELVVYLIPNQLNSYQRMKEGAGGFTERLNSIFTYDLFCLGMKGTQRLAFISKNVNAGNTIPASLQPVDENALRQMLGRSGQRIEGGLLEEARFHEWLGADKQRRKQNQARVDLKNALLPVVFPCTLGVARPDSIQTHVMKEYFPVK